MAVTRTTTKKVPRHAFFAAVDAATPSRGSSVYDLLLNATLNRDAYDSWFDDFHGDQLDDRYTVKVDTGATTTANSTAILNSTASDNKYAGFTGGGLGWTGGQNCMMQVRAKSTSITENKFEIGFTGVVAGNAGCVNSLNEPTWTAAEDTVIFCFDTDATNDCWQVLAYNSAAPKKRQLYLTRTSTGAAATTLTDTSASSWIANSLAGQTITVGTAPNLTRGVIASNSTTIATLAGGWSNGTPAAASTYVIANAPVGLVVPVAGAYATYTVKLEGTTALFYINGIQVAMIPAAVSATTVALTPWLFAQARGTGATAAILTVDYIWLMQSRRVTA